MTDRDDIDELRRLLHESAPDVPADPGRAASARGRAARLRRARRATYAGVAAAVLVVVAVPVGLRATGDSERATAPTGPGALTQCQTTRQVPKDQVPKALRGLPGSRWVGADGLWVDTNGLTGSLSYRRLKFGVFTLDAQGRMSNAAGPPSLTAEQVGGSRTVKGDRMVPDNYATATDSGRTVHFWPTTISLPADGCWRLTVRAKESTVHLDVRVAADATR